MRSASLFLAQTLVYGCVFETVAIVGSQRSGSVSMERLGQTPRKRSRRASNVGNPQNLAFWRGCSRFWPPSGGTAKVAEIGKGDREDLRRASRIQKLASACHTEGSGGSGGNWWGTGGELVGLICPPPLTIWAFDTLIKCHF